MYTCACMSDEGIISISSCHVLGILCRKFQFTFFHFFRVFSFLDVISLCRCAQVSKVGVVCVCG